MNTLYFDDEKIIYTVRKKKLFSKKMKEVQTVILFNDITCYCEDYYENELVSIELTLSNKAAEEFIDKDELEDPRKFYLLVEKLKANYIKSDRFDI